MLLVSEERDDGTRGTEVTDVELEADKLSGPSSQARREGWTHSHTDSENVSRLSLEAYLFTKLPCSLPWAARTRDLPLSLSSPSPPSFSLVLQLSCQLFAPKVTSNGPLLLWEERNLKTQPSNERKLTHVQVDMF